MRILIGLAEPLPPQASGGSQRVAFEVAAGLRAMGGDPVVAGRLMAKRLPVAGQVLSALARGRFYAIDHGEHGPVYKFFREGRAFPALLDRIAPDVVLLHVMSAMPLAQVVVERQVPLVLYWHDIEFHKLRGEPPETGARHVANSAFTAGRVRDRFGVDPVVIPPVFAPILGGEGKGLTARDRVLFINPVADKGLELALRIAALSPDIPFEFLESWTLDAEQRRTLSARLAVLPNVAFTPRQPDMEPIYARAKFLLAPSRWEEAWGRVATEAQAHGLPVIATRTGGLTEAVGPGGVLLARGEPPGAWAEVVARLWRDPAFYASLASAATAHAGRPEVDPSRNLRRLQFELEAATAR